MSSNGAMRNGTRILDGAACTDDDSITLSVWRPVRGEALTSGHQSHEWRPYVWGQSNVVLRPVVPSSRCQ